MQNTYNPKVKAADPDVHKGNNFIVMDVYLRLTLTK